MYVPRRRPSSTIVHLHLIVAFLSLLGFSWTASAVDTSVLTPATLDDGQGNTADENSDISFRDVKDPPRDSMKCSGCVGDGGIRPFLDGAENFAHMVSPDFPYEMVEKVTDNRISEITDDYQKLIDDNMGMVVCVGIGFLFILIFPIVGCCFCCCRCCGKCGGSRRTDGEPKGGCARTVFILVQFVLAIFVMVGGAMVLTTSGSITDGLNTVHDDVPSNLDSLKDFFNDSTKVINEIATTDLNFTRDVVFRDLDNIGHIFGGMVRDNFLNQTNDHITAISTSVKRMDSALGSLKEQIPEVNAQLGYMKDNVTAYVNAMTTIKTEFDTGIVAAGGSETAPAIDTAIDTTQMNDFSGTSDIDKVGNLTEKLDNSLKEIDDIPEQVHNESTQSVADIKSNILGYTSDVTDTTDDLDIADKIDTDDMKDKIVDYVDQALEYDDYRQYASQGLGGIILLISALLIVGLVLGVCGGSGSTPPHERGCASNSGGNFLVAAVILTFIFGSLLMLFTTLPFIVGTPIENYGCAAFRDTGIMDTLIDDYDVLGSSDGTGTYLGDKILDNPNDNMTLSEILSACKNNEAMYKAFRINQSSFFNISEILDYKSDFSVTDDLSSVNVDFSTIKIMTPDLETNLKDLNDSIQYNFTTYTSELERNATKEAVDFENYLRTTTPSSPGEQAVYDATADKLQLALDNEGKALQDSMDLLKTQLDDLSNTMDPPAEPSISEEIGTVQTAMEALDNSLESAGNSSFDSALKSFTDRVFGVVDSYIDRLLYALDNDIGKCYPVWDLYSTILLESICGTVIASLNGFWFAIGWSLFFMMPSIVFACKLATRFRRMTLYEYDDCASVPASDIVMEEAPPKPHGRLPPLIHPNKVGPMDAPYDDKKW